MDPNEYMPMFLAEAQEHLQELNLAIVRLEDDPKDRATVDSIFRIAHSLKGMSATMGFTQIATLTHEMEDVFELLRQRERALTREALDTVFACLDALSGAVDSIEEDGSERLDPAPLTERLRGLVHARSPEQEALRGGGRAEPDLAAAFATGMRVVHVLTTLGSEVQMPGVRAHMVLTALAHHGELIGSAPVPEGIEQFEGREIEAWLATEEETSTLSAAANAISDVASVTARELGPEDVPAAAGGGVATRRAAAPEAAVDPEPAAAIDPERADAPGPASAPTSAAAPAAPAAPAQRGGGAARTVRVDAERLDALMHAIGELVIHRTAVEAHAAAVDAPELQQAVQELTRCSQTLQSMVMQVRMIAVDVVFLRFPRVVRDLAGKLGKQVKLELVGAETELDRTVVDALGDPLAHLVRNALDHGLEPAAERASAGKDECGTLQISARHAGGGVVIEVRDDGRGIDARKVAQKAAESGLIDPAQAADIDLPQAIELLFAPGFSTATETSDISGRGVGMDAVRAKIRGLGGEVTMDSVPGQGTAAQIRLPLTLAIVSGLLVEIGGAPYAIPLERIDRTLSLEEVSVQSFAGERLLVLDDGVLPLIDATRVFKRPQHPHTYAIVVRVGGGEERIALAVDELIGQRELVTRPLPGIVSDGEPVSGGAALLDGRIALIVDCDAMVDAAHVRPSATALAA